MTIESARQQLQYNMFIDAPQDQWGEWRIKISGNTIKNGIIESIFENDCNICRFSWYIYLMINSNSRYFNLSINQLIEICPKFFNQMTYHALCVDDMTIGVTNDNFGFDDLNHEDLIIKKNKSARKIGIDYLHGWNDREIKFSFENCTIPDSVMNDAQILYNCLSKN